MGTNKQSDMAAVPEYNQQVVDELLKFATLLEPAIKYLHTTRYLKRRLDPNERLKPFEPLYKSEP